MFEQDYLMRIIAQLLGAIRRSMERAAGEEDPDGAARALDMALGLSLIHISRFEGT